MTLVSPIYGSSESLLEDVSDGISRFLEPSSDEKELCSQFVDHEIAYESLELTDKKLGQG